MAAAVSAIMAAFGLLLNWKAIRESRKTRELQIFYSVFKDIKDLEEKQPKYVEEGKQQAWNSLFFNTLEFFSFLVNKKMVSDKRVAEFFKDSVNAWYEQVFWKNSSPKERDDPGLYTELKELYKKFKK